MNRLLIPLALAVLSCGTAQQNLDVVDARAPIPEADPTFIDFVGTEFEVQPGKEVMMCLHLQYDGPETAFSYMETAQGKFGHHAVLLTALEPKEPGTIEDCTDVKDMNKYDAFTIGDLQLPTGYGAYLPANKKMVLQSHYVNTGKKPILVRDILRMKKMAIADVQKWAAVITTNLMTVSIPPRSAGVTQSFDCTVNKDVELLAFGGHMHEYGTKISIDVGPSVNALSREYTVDQWTADYRDNPPINLYTTAPKQVPAGSVVRVSCTWDNTTDQPMGFPTEMCASFGFVGGTKDPVVCRFNGI